MAGPDEKALVAQILSSYLSHNTVTAADLPSVIESVKKAFSGADGVSTETSETLSKNWQPVVPVKRSITPEAITCLACGRKFKSLRRHIQSVHQLTPSAYRSAFNLKSDYPIVAPSYAARRSELAKSLGLGRKAGIKSGSKKGARRSAKKPADAA